MVVFSSDIWQKLLFLGRKDLFSILDLSKIGKSSLSEQLTSAASTVLPD